MTMSQDEINAMLSGLDEPGDGASPPEESGEETLDTQLQADLEAELAAAMAAEDSAAPEGGDMQASLEAELAAAMAAEEPAAPSEEMTSGIGVPRKLIDFDPAEWQLSTEEVDVLGEVGNMCMGAVATTMYTLLDRRVSITTPVVSVHTTQEVLSMYTTPFVVVEVEYVEGIDGKNLLLLKEYDAALITDLLMGGEGSVEEPVELNELHMSAISEIMNQMIGASATAMAKILSMPVNISPPSAVRIGENTDVSEFLDESQIVVKISFDMEIEGLLSSQLLQMLPYSLTKDLVSTVKAVGGLLPHDQAKASLSTQTETILAHADSDAAVDQTKVVDASIPTAPAPVQIPQQPVPAPQPYATDPYQQPYPQQPYPGYPPQYAPPADYGYYQQPQPYPQQAPPPQPGNLVDVRPMQFQSFDQGGTPAPATGGMGLVGDIPLQVSVELGKTKKDISEILEFGMGTVLVLDKIAGDPVEILVNGKLVARGEVVVIEENYGVRITDIVNS